MLAAASRERQAGRRAATPDGRRRARARIHAGVLAGRAVGRLRDAGATPQGGAVWKVRVPADASAAPAAGERVTPTPGHYINPVWSPSGDRLAVIRGSGLEFRGRQPEDERVVRDSLAQRRLAASPQFVTSGRRAARAAVPSAGALEQATARGSSTAGRVERKSPTDDPKTDLVSIRLDGTDRKPLLRLPPVDDLAPSPDEQWLAVLARATRCTSRRCRRRGSTPTPEVVETRAACPSGGSPTTRAATRPGPTAAARSPGPLAPSSTA